MAKLLINAFGAQLVANAAIFKALAEAGYEPTLADPEPVRYKFWDTKKSKGDKHRDRAERRRKWGI